MIDDLQISQRPDEQDEDAGAAADQDIGGVAGLVLTACDMREALPIRVRAAQQVVVSPEWANTPPITREAILSTFRPNIRSMLEADAEAGGDAAAKPFIPLSAGDDDDDGKWKRVGSLLAFAGQSTVLSAPGKAGKTTMCAALAVGVAEGRDWLTNEEAPPADVLWLAAPGESNRADVRLTCLATGCRPAALDRIFVHEGGAGGVRERVAAGLIPDLKLVVADSMRGFLPAGAENLENDSGAVRRIWRMMDEIRAAAGNGAALVAIHHTRRQRGEDGKLTRGSGDWLATFGNIVEMTQESGGRRLSFDSRESGPSGSRLITRFGRPGRKRYKLDNQPAQTAPDKYEDAALAAAVEAGPDGIGLSALKKTVADALGLKARGGKTSAQFKSAILRLVEAGKLRAVGPLHGHESKRTIVTATPDEPADDRAEDRADDRGDPRQDSLGIAP